MLSRKINLRTILIGFSTGGIVLCSSLLLGSISILQRSEIERNLLEGNRAYAIKLAGSVDRILSNSHKDMEWSAGQIHGVKDVGRISNIIDRLQSSPGYFNSVALISSERKLIYASPKELNTVGLIVQSKNSRDATTLQKPLISEPFTTSAGNYAIVVSYPVFSFDKKYVGYIGGTIYLRKKSMLSEILSQHYYDNHTKISIISNDGDVIYSDEEGLIGNKITLDDEIKKNILLNKEKYLQNKNGYLIGYARVSRTNWTVFITTEPGNVSITLMRIVKDASWIIFSIVIFMIFISIYISRKISSPLEKLAKATGFKDSKETLALLPEINCWYAESVELTEAIHKHVLMMFTRVKSLKEEVMTDPLTGILNRRGFNKMVATYVHVPCCSIIAIDIDHFKRVNDTFGHEAGDEVLVSFAVLLKNISRIHDVFARFGGEEFIILLPDTSLKDTFLLAERIREDVEKTEFPLVGRITISAGISGDDEIESLLKQADEALYKAKANGRNQVISWSDNKE